MMEIIYDEAPGITDFAFASGTASGPVGKANSINQLTFSGAERHRRRHLLPQRAVLPGRRGRAGGRQREGQQHRLLRLGRQPRAPELGGQLQPLGGGAGVSQLQLPVGRGHDPDRRQRAQRGLPRSVAAVGRAVGTGRHRRRRVPRERHDRSGTCERHHRQHPDRHPERRRLLVEQHRRDGAGGPAPAALRRRPPAVHEVHRARELRDVLDRPVGHRLRHDQPRRGVGRRLAHGRGDRAERAGAQRPRALQLARPGVPPVRQERRSPAGERAVPAEAPARGGRRREHLRPGLPALRGAPAPRRRAPRGWPRSSSPRSRRCRSGSWR